MKLYKLAPLCGVLLLAMVAPGCNKLKARDQLNKGVAAYRNAQFQTAIMHFKNAVSLDPGLLNARLYLATAYANQYVPGGDSADNLKIAQQAIEAFQDVLNRDPSNTTAISSIAQIYYQEKNFDKAKEYQLQRIKIEPNNPEPYYWIGVLDWAIAFPRTQELRNDLHIQFPRNTEDPNSLPPLPEKARAQLAEQNGPLVAEGLEMLQKAIELKPNDADSMVYLNLMYRQKAELEKDARTREADLKTANEWVEKALALKKSGGGAKATTTSSE